MFEYGFFFYFLCCIPSNRSIYLFFYFVDIQSLAVVTLGDKQMAQKIDNLVDEEEFKRFYLQVGISCMFLIIDEL